MNKHDALLKRWMDREKWLSWKRLDITTIRIQNKTKREIEMYMQMIRDWNAR